MNNPNKKTISVTIDNSKNQLLSPLLVEENLLTQEFRKRKDANNYKSAHIADVSNEEAKGWKIQRSWKRTTRLKRLKSHDKWLEDRTWSLFYRMGYRVMNAENFKIGFERTDGSTGKKQVDVYAEDEETALVIECKSREEVGSSFSTEGHSSGRIKFVFATRSNVL